MRDECHQHGEEDIVKVREVDLDDDIVDRDNLASLLELLAQIKELGQLQLASKIQVRDP